MPTSWIEQLWLAKLEAEAGRPSASPDWLALPAIGRLTVTRPELLKPFEAHNRRQPDEALRPGSFISVAYPKLFTQAGDLRLFAPFVSDPARALEVDWYELRSGDQVRITTNDPLGVITAGVIPVKSYGDVAREYAVHPEAKFLSRGGGPCVRTSVGKLMRRSIVAVEAEYIWKGSQPARPTLRGSRRA